MHSSRVPHFVMVSACRKVQEAVGSHSCFGQLTDSQRLALINVGRQTTLSSTTILFQHGDPYRGFYLVISGTAQTYRLSPDGRMLVLRVLQPTESFAESPLFEQGDSATHMATAETLEESRMLFIPKRPFRRFAAENPQVYPKLLQMLGNRLRGAVRQIDALSLQDVQQRLAGYLMRQVSGEEKNRATAPTVELDVPKAVLAAKLGTVPETLSRTLTRLEQRNLIRSEASKIVLTGMSELRRLSRGT
jgi:CRP-like cAMP-binding protein